MVYPKWKKCRSCGGWGKEVAVNYCSLCGKEITVFYCRKCEIDFCQEECCSHEQLIEHYIEIIQEISLNRE